MCVVLVIFEYLYEKTSNRIKIHQPQLDNFQINLTPNHNNNKIKELIKWN